MKIGTNVIFNEENYIRLDGYMTMEIVKLRSRMD